MDDEPLARSHAHLLAEGLDGIFLIGNFLGNDLCLNANDVDAAMKIIEGTARQMGVTVSE